jgi:two-component system cell cycle sensor histidine kinase/response regulator CckA
MTSILVVEDERIVARDLKESLERMGYEVVGSAATSQEALEIAANRLPALVMMDIRIDGEVDGIETANVLRSRFDIPVIFLTAYADDDTLDRAKSSAPLGYIVKPFKSAEIRGAIEMALVRHALERRIREREHWFATTLRSVGDAVVAVDAAGAVKFANPVAERLLGAAESTLLGREVEDVIRIVDEKSQAPLPNPVTRAIRDRRAADLPEAVLLQNAPRTQPIEDSSAPIIDDAGRLLGAVMVFRDVTEKRREQMRSALNDRLTSLGTLVAGVAHELNNPLTALYGHSELMRGELDDLLASEPPQPLQRSLERLLHHANAMMESSHMMGDIVADLRLFSSPQSDELERVDVRSAVDTALRRTSALVRERARLVLEMESAPLVMASKRRLVQVFINLLTNAAQAIPRGSREKNEIAVRLDTTPQGEARISIRDSGVGMPAETARSIFDPFFTTKSLGEGSGLGLSISHGIVRSFHGAISVVSEPGRGSLFIITLPAAPAVTAN